MSAKDLCTIDFLDQIVRAGASVLKLEGRGRAPDYVFTVTRCYREALDAIRSGNYDSVKAATWKQELATVYNRGFWDGYYLGRKMGEWADAYGSKATERKIFIGRARNYFDRIQVAEFEMETQSLKVGDKVLVTGPVTGVIYTGVRELRVDVGQVETVVKNDIFSMPLECRVRPSDKLYKIVEST